MPNAGERRTTPPSTSGPSACIGQSPWHPDAAPKKPARARVLQSSPLQGGTERRLDCDLNFEWSRCYAVRCRANRHRSTDRQTVPPSFLPHRFPPSIYPIPTQTDKPSTERWSKEGLAGRSFACISIRPKRVRRVVGSNTAVNSRPLCIQRRCRPAPSTHGNGSGTTDPDAISGRPRARRS